MNSTPVDFAAMKSWNQRVSVDARTSAIPLLCADNFLSQGVGSEYGGLSQMRPSHDSTRPSVGSDISRCAVACPGKPHGLRSNAPSLSIIQRGVRVVSLVGDSSVTDHLLGDKRISMASTISLLSLMAACLRGIVALQACASWACEPSQTAYPQNACTVALRWLVPWRKWPPLFRWVP